MPKELAFVPFASTASLNFYGIRNETDERKIYHLAMDPQIQRTGPAPIKPPIHTKVKNAAEWLTTGVLSVVIESKTPLKEKTDKADEGKEGKESKEGEEEEDDRFVGFASLHSGLPGTREATFGIALDPKWWGRGLGTEITQWVLEHGFQHIGLHRVALEMIASNERALKLYKKVGFVEEGRKRKFYWANGQWNDLIIMGILEEEWQATRQK